MSKKLLMNGNKLDLFISLFDLVGRCRIKEGVFEQEPLGHKRLVDRFLSSDPSLG